MRKRTILITGASGEIGQALIRALSDRNSHQLLTLDLHALPPETKALTTHIEGDILDEYLLGRLVSQYEFDAIYHLAALLSTRAEFVPEAAHKVNVEGTLRLLKMAAEQSQWRGQAVQFIFPSSIAVYGLPDLETKGERKLREWEYNNPTTMYGCNKLYCELLGGYYSHSYRQLAADKPAMLDFRSLRFPGLISAFTLPTGGTSDYAPEMIHAAAQNQPYHCFVRPDSIIPFMAMPDAVTALLKLAQAPRSALSRTVYNVTGFSLTAEAIRERVMAEFPEAQIDYRTDLKRQAIVDSWPADIHDAAATADWGWQPEYNADRTFNEYLFPNIRQRYQG
jgi:nucleoside-diphosphate-sugar epimerase